MISAPVQLTFPDMEMPEPVKSQFALDTPHLDRLLVEIDHYNEGQPTPLAVIQEATATNSSLLDRYTTERRKVARPTDTGLPPLTQRRKLG